MFARDKNGRFRNYTLRDFGIQVNEDFMVCGKCGYGEHEKWIPVLKAGKCPKCGNQKGHKEKIITLSKKAEKLINDIGKLEIKIGNPFPHPLLLQNYGDELKRMQGELDIEIKHCIDESFK